VEMVDIGRSVEARVSQHFSLQSSPPANRHDNQPSTTSLEAENTNTAQMSSSLILYIIIIMVDGRKSLAFAQNAKDIMD